MAIAKRWVAGAKVWVAGAKAWVAVASPAAMVIGNMSAFGQRDGSPRSALWLTLSGTRALEP